jgi:hypothetical protein
MMGRQDEPERLFYEFRLESQIPSDHLPRKSAPNPSTTAPFQARPC